MSFTQRKQSDKSEYFKQWLEEKQISYSESGVEFTDYVHSKKPYSSWEEVEARSIPDFYLNEYDKYCEVKTVKVFLKANIELLPFIFNLKNRNCYYIFIDNNNNIIKVKPQDLVAAIQIVTICRWRTDIDWQIEESIKFAKEINAQLNTQSDRPNSYASGTPYITIDLTKIPHQVLLWKMN